MTTSIIVLLVAVGLVLLLTLGFFVGMRIETAARNQAWMRVAEARRANAESRRALAERETELEMRAKELESIGANSAVETWSERPLRQADLLLRLVEIEAYAQEVLNKRLGVEERNVFEIREGLRRLGTWSDDDVATFDRAMRLRNSIVHDRGTGVRTLDSVSRSMLEELSKKLQSAAAG